MTPVYLDHAATTPPRPEVIAAMTQALADGWGNPSSVHAAGRRARALLDEAHDQVAAAIGAESRAVVFTSGGTEAINFAVKGAAWAGKATGHRIVTTAVEHDAVLNSARHLEKFGFEVVILPVDRYGRLDPDELSRALTERTVLVSLGLGNNEVGTLADARELAERVRSGCRALIHLDAVQAAAWLALDVTALGADLVSLSGHKLEGPKGIGALWIRRGVAILPQQHGGSQERYRRAGTEHLAGAVGMGRAMDLLVGERPGVAEAVRGLRDRLVAALLAIPDVELTGHPRDRLPNHVSVIVAGVDGESLVPALDLEGICASRGSACASGSPEPSHVLTAMGYPADEARCALRLTLGRTTSAEDVDRAIDRIGSVIGRLRAGAASLPAVGPAARPSLLGIARGG